MRNVGKLSTRPELVDAVIRKTFTAMIEGVREAAIEARMVTSEVFAASSVLSFL